MIGYGDYRVPLVYSFSPLPPSLTCCLLQSPQSNLQINIGTRPKEGSETLMQVEHFHESTMDYGHCSEEKEALLSNNKHEGACSIIKSSRTAIHELGIYIYNGNSLFHL